MTFYPAIDGITIHFGAIKVDEVRYPPEFTKLYQKHKKLSEEHHKHDYALLFLSKPIGFKAGFLGIAADVKKFKGLDLKLTGYPRDKTRDKELRFMW